jgi:hypothetical protein
LRSFPRRRDAEISEINRMDWGVREALGQGIIEPDNRTT